MSELGEILKLLETQTNQGKIPWKLVGDAVITVQQGGSVLELREAVPEVAYQFTIRNNDGIALSSINLVQGVDGFEEARNIFQKTKRDALGVTQALQEIKRSLLHQ